MNYLNRLKYFHRGSSFPTVVYGSLTVAPLRVRHVLIDFYVQ